MTNSPVLNSPGEKVTYSNAGSSLAAAMAERVSGKIRKELIQDKLFRPLNIQAFVGYDHPARIDPKQTWGHILNAGEDFIPHSPGRKASA